VTSSFDAVNRMARSLEQSTMFREAQIADAKMSIDGSRIDFRINLTFNGDQIGR
jgi:general secretion pathway protein L